MSTEYVQGTAKGKLYLFICLVLAVVLGVLILGEGQPSEKLSMASEAELIELIAEGKRNALIYLFTAVLCQPLIWFMAFKTYKFGQEIKVSGCYPPPGANVAFKTKILVGQKAQNQEQACFIGAFIIVIIGLSFVALCGWGYVSFNAVMFSV